MAAVNQLQFSTNIVRFKITFTLKKKRQGWPHFISVNVLVVWMSSGEEEPGVWSTVFSLCVCVCAILGKAI